MDGYWLTHSHSSDPSVDTNPQTPPQLDLPSQFPPPQTPTHPKHYYQAGLVEPERLALLHKARRLVDTGYALPAVAAGARTRHGGRSRSVAAAPECLRGRVAAGAALPEVEVAVVKPPAQAPEKPPPQKTKTQTRKRRGRKRKRQQRGAVDEEEEEEEKAETGEGRGAVAAPAAAAAPAEVRNEVLARVLGIPPPPSLEGDGKSPVAAAAIAQAQAGEEKSGPVVFPRELFVELEALMGVRWADAWRG